MTLLLGLVSVTGRGPDNGRQGPTVMRRRGIGRVVAPTTNSEITVASAVVIAYFLGALFALGTKEAFYQVGFARLRLMAYSILAGYLFGSIALLRWAVHQWTRHSRSAFLVAPLIIAATGATILAFIIGSAIL